METLTPEIFDALVIVNLALGLLLAGRRFWRDIRRSPGDKLQAGGDN